jgi:hypothetical protein
MDEESALWPISTEIIDDYEEIKYDFHARPLVVYKNDLFVEPTEVECALKNALVEIHFGVLHYKMTKESTTFDSFSAVPKQILILKEAPVEVPSTYKRKNVRSGPVRPKNFEDFRKGVPDPSKGKNIASGSRK